MSAARTGSAASASRALPCPCVCLVTDRRRLSPGARTTRDEIIALERWLDEAIDAGVDMIQIRERDLDASALAALARAVAARSRDTPTIVIVNDRADVAYASAAAGVHLRADGAPVVRVREFAPSGWIVGRSIHTPEELSAAGDADYLVFGTVYPTGSKPPSAPIQGLERLRAAAVLSPAPILAIGGITIERAAECLAAGAAGVAAIGLFLPVGRSAGALGASVAVRSLREMLK